MSSTDPVHAPDASDTTAEFFWPWSLLAQPAFTSAEGPPLNPWMRVRMNSWVDGVLKGLMELLELPVRVRWLPYAGSPDPNQIPFAVRVRSGGSGQGFFIGAHEGSARLLVDRLEHRWFGLRRPDGLTAEEFGMLEYLTLELADRLLSVPADPPSFRLVKFIGGQEFAVALAGSGLVPHALELQVGGRAGLLTLWLPAVPVEVDWRPSGAEPGDLSGGRDSICFGLALPPVRLAASEVGSLRAGDALLLGASSLEALSQRCRMVTSTGWQFARATLLEDRPAWLRWRIETPEPFPLAAAPPGSSEVLLYPILGAIHRPLSELVNYRTGREFEAGKQQPPVCLFGPRGPLWRCEIGRLSGEVALSLLEPA